MKGVKGRFLKKLKLIPSITTLKQGLVLQLNPHNNNNTFSNQTCHTLSVYNDCIKSNNNNNINHPENSLVGTLKDQKDEETESEFDIIVKDDDDNSIHPAEVQQHSIVSLTDFEEKCPPGGEESVIFYTTSMRGIRKTFEDCSSVRFLLDSFKISVQERDVSMDMEFREELWRVLGGRVIPPKLFIKGRYIGGADEVVGLHEQGKLKKLFEGIPSALPKCAACANVRFLVCSNCHGSRKVFADKEKGEELCMKCPDCNENGLVKCPVCC